MQWREDWLSASVGNHSIITDPTSDNQILSTQHVLIHHTWSLLNCFQAGQGPCRANLHKWSLAQSPSCDCG